MIPVFVPLRWCSLEQRHELSADFVDLVFGGRSLCSALLDMVPVKSFRTDGNLRQWQCAGYCKLPLLCAYIFGWLIPALKVRYCCVCMWWLDRTSWKIGADVPVTTRLFALLVVQTCWAPKTTLFGREPGENHPLTIHLFLCFVV